MHEASKAAGRRGRDSAFTTRYFVGDGIDVGCGPDSVGNHRHLFPLMGSVTNWDLKQGDAQELRGVADNAYQWLHASHVLEHVRDPFEALKNWCRVVCPHGHLVILVPDEDLYEQGIWPSSWNCDHKHTFTIQKQRSWSPVSLNVCELIRSVQHLIVPIKIELLDLTFDRSGARRDQTQGPIAECAIEIVLRRPARN